ncbi:MAG: PAS domain-containing sensor histidine kinase [Bryobacteraceae bacterium]
MPESRPISKLLGGRSAVLVATAASLALVVTAEWITDLDFPLSVFYILPVLIAASVLSRPQIVLVATGCAYIHGYFLTNNSPVQYWATLLMAITAYVGAGLFMGELSRNRRALVEAYTRLKLEQQLRYRAEDQLRLLADTSPAAILTLNHRGEVLSANRAAHDLLDATPNDSLIGEQIGANVPVFAGALRMTAESNSVRASASTWARTLNGARFPVATWFSTYGAGEDRFLAGILVDMSEEVRDRELEAFRQFGEYNRLLASAVSHEIRNMCLAIRVVTSNLRLKRDLSDDADFSALSTLVESLSRIASFELQNNKRHGSTTADPQAVLEELRVVIAPDWADAGGELHWELNPMPEVHADPHSLLQVLLNLAHNSLRAMQDQDVPSLVVQTRTEADYVIMSIIDSGPGIGDTTKLFQPFRPDAGGSGLGLYISRTIMRSLDGDLKHVPTERGCQFDVIVPVIGGLAPQTAAESAVLVRRMEVSA